MGTVKVMAQQVNLVLICPFVLDYVLTVTKSDYTELKTSSKQGIIYSFKSR